MIGGELAGVPAAWCKVGSLQVYYFFELGTKLLGDLVLDSGINIRVTRYHGWGFELYRPPGWRFSV